MGRIHVLDDVLINRIAAGEVVERPASVVKELLENALDADATAVDVALEAGGRRTIRVTDNGHGMDRDDALLALERHATSKFSRIEDLDDIRTLGFRGEALPSIAAVSDFVLRTATEDGAGVEVIVRGGTIRDVRDVGSARGTSVRVDRLFGNVPARRKFLRTEATELSHAVRLVTRYALANPGLRCRLAHGARVLLDTPAAATLEERVGQIYGADFVRAMLPFDARRGDVRAHGLAGRPVDALPRRDAQHLVGNGRSVQDRVLAHAVMQAYGNTMPRGRHPALVLFVELPTHEVDVNVHPQKTEVRFRRSGEVHDGVRDAVHGALSSARAVPELGDLRPEAVGEGNVGAADAAATWLETHEPAPRPFPAPAASGEREALPLPLPGMARDESPGARALGQYEQSYIVAEDEDGLVLIDQHAAHERVIFERYLAEAEENRVETQGLMFPVTVELSPDECVLLEAETEEFRRLGFSLEAFGGSSFRVDGVPAVAARLEPERLLRELLGEAAKTRSAATGADDLRSRLVTSAACQAAIKVHHPLTRDKMQGLIDDLYRTENPSTCPHGRPALFRLTLDEIERAFRRR